LVEQFRKTHGYGGSQDTRFDDDLDALIKAVSDRQKERDAEICEAETELPGAMPDELWAKLKKQTMETILRQNVRAVKKSIANAIRTQEDK